jgi:hypothetical protein
MLIAIVVLGLMVLLALPACALPLTVQLFPLTGEIQLRNEFATPFDFTFYSITSNSGALNGSPGVWKSISDNYDVSGNGFIDPANNWNKLAGSANELSEGVVPGPGGSLAPMRAISLGNVWNPNAVPDHDLVVEILDSNNVLADITIETALAGDYSGNRIVDNIDYIIWRQFFGSTTILLADGNLNGEIDAADYVLWRDNLGKNILGFGEGGGASLVVGTTVPEPSTAALFMLALGVSALAAVPPRGRCARNRRPPRP